MISDDVKSLILASDSAVQQSESLRQEAHQQSLKLQVLLFASKQLCRKAPRRRQPLRAETPQEDTRDSS